MKPNPQRETEMFAAGARYTIAYQNVLRFWTPGRPIIPVDVRGTCLVVHHGLLPSPLQPGRLVWCRLAQIS